FESAATYDATTGGGSLAAGFADLRPQDQPSGQVRAWDPNLHPQFTQQWKVFAEHLVRPPGTVNAGCLGHHATNPRTPARRSQPRPGPGDPSAGAPVQNRRPLFATAPLITNVSTTAPRGRSNYAGLQASLRQRALAGLEYLASYTLGSAKANQLGYYGSGGFTAAEGTYWMNAYDPEANYGPAFFDVRHNFVLSASYALPYGRDSSRASAAGAPLRGWG